MFFLLMIRRPLRITRTATLVPSTTLFRSSVWLEEVAAILAAGTRYGDSDAGAGRKVNVEFVSANPTGPLHAAHARGAVFGDALAALLAKAGFTVTRQYYIHDPGTQVETPAWNRYLSSHQALRA